MKNIKTLILLLLLASTGFGQSLSPRVTATAGGRATGSGVSLSYTTGETFNTKLSANNQQLTQGQQQPEIDLRLDISEATVCAGYNISVPFSAAGYVDASNVFTVELSDANGSFANPVIIGSVISMVSGSIEATVPATSIAGSGYKARLVSSKPERTTSDVLNVTINTCTTTLNLTAFLEGFYIGNGIMRANLYDLGISTNDTETDSVEVNLWSAANLSSATPDYSVKTVLHTDGTLTAVFPGATLNNNYYVALKHRNSIELWSAEPIKINPISNYDFSTSLSSAYTEGFNDPMKSVSSGIYAIYAGDVNQDGTVDIFDAQITENEASNLLFGYDASDCNGDGLSDIFDLQLIENNSTLLLYYARPY
jgi:hypothetical protein